MIILNLDCSASLATQLIIFIAKKNARESTCGIAKITYDIKRSLVQCMEPFLQSLERETVDMVFSIETECHSQKFYAEQHIISYSTLKTQVQKGRRQSRELYGRCCSSTFDQCGNLLGYDLKLKNCKKC
jgi:RNA polymerase sigma-70 factor (ECF subfamily)